MVSNARSEQNRACPQNAFSQPFCSLRSSRRSRHRRERKARCKRRRRMPSRRSRPITPRSRSSSKAMSGASRPAAERRVCSRRSAELRRGHCGRPMGNALRSSRLERARAGCSFSLWTAANSSGSPMTTPRSNSKRGRPIAVRFTSRPTRAIFRRRRMSFVSRSTAARRCPCSTNATSTRWTRRPLPTAMRWRSCETVLASGGAAATATWINPRSWSSTSTRARSIRSRAVIARTAGRCGRPTGIRSTGSRTATATTSCGRAPTRRRPAN